MMIYTDGSSTGGVGPGGWAFVAVSGIDNAPVHEASGHDPHTTNNRMELQAIVEAMRWAGERPCTILSDSQLCVKTLTTWARGWRRRGWFKYDGGVPMNLDIVRPALELYEAGRFKLRWVRGHAGNVFNERADVLAGQARLQGRPDPLPPA